MIIETIGSLRPRSGDIGIEIEVEGRDLPGRGGVGGTAGFDKLWGIHMDGSLRGESLEFVLRRPLKLNKLRTALFEVELSYKLCGSKISDSIRTGVHVHINCQKLTMTKAMNFACLYFTLEELLLQLCAPSRRGNHFCLRAKDAEYMLFQLRNVLLGKRFRQFSNDSVRYSSINFCALPKFGSIEFRGLESGNFNKIYDWASILLNLRDIACTYSNPIDVVQSMSQDGYETFLAHVLGDNYPLFEAIPNKNELLLTGVRQAQDMAYGIDWNEMDEGWGERRKTIDPMEFDDDEPEGVWDVGLTDAERNLAAPLEPREDMNHNTWANTEPGVLAQPITQAQINNLFNAQRLVFQASDTITNTED